MATDKVPFKPHFGAFVLETLTLGMYGESRNALREYIQNSFDSLRQAVDDGLITEDEAEVEITLDADRQGLTIRDFGGGLGTENAVSVLASVGASNKDYRRNAGFRGIGRLAGIAFCDTLVFTTKRSGQTRRSVVTFDAKRLREKLSPGGAYGADAADTLESCVVALHEDDLDADGHYFEVRLQGFFDPPVECKNFDALKSYLGQVSPLAYRPDFKLGHEIVERARKEGVDITWVRVLARDGDGPLEELFKPYRLDVGVKKTRVPLIIDYVASPRAAWWGWVGRKRISGTLKDADSRGIRVRVRNIQIDDTKIMRDIFTVSHLGGKPRSSYARFADYYVGEIFVQQKAAIPNARRDGFEEDQAWQKIRDELDTQVAEKYGKLAYKTSTADQLSVDSLNKRLVEFRKSAEPLIAAKRGDWDVVSQAVAEANEIQRRLSLAVKAADEEELAPIRGVAESVASLKRGLETLVLTEPAGDPDCEEAVAKALSSFTQKLYRALHQRLAPGEWQRAREVLRDLSGEEPQ